MTALYAPYAIRYETDGMSGTPALLGGITRQSISTNSQESQEAVAGSHYPLWLGLTGQKVVGEFTTKNVETALTAMAPPADILAGDGIQFWQVKKTSGAVDSGSVHRTAKIADGIVVPRRLTIPGDGDAEISYEVISQYDGTNDPIIFTETAALPSETLTDVARWGMGNLQIGSLAIDGCTQIEIDFGVRAEQLQTDGDIWAQYIDLSEYLAKITIRSIDTSKVSDSGILLEGKTGTHATSYLYLRKRDDGGYDSGEEHIKITFDGLVYADSVWDARGNERGECNLVCLLRYDGTNAPLVFTYNQALA